MITVIINMHKNTPPTSLKAMRGWVTIEHARAWQKNHCSALFTAKLANINPDARYCGRWVRAIEIEFNRLLAAANQTKEGKQ